MQNIPKKTSLFVYSKLFYKSYSTCVRSLYTRTTSRASFDIKKKEKEKKWQRKQKKAIKNGSYETSESPPKRYYF